MSNLPLVLVVIAATLLIKILTTGLSVRAAIAAKRDVTPEVANKWRARARTAGHLQETREQAQTT